MSELAKESTRWYDSAGKPCNSIVGANGKERAPTLRDARKLDLLPSVTTIMQILAAPNLVNWKVDEAIKAALETPRSEGETDAEFVEKVKFQAGEKARQARERGTLLHGDIQKAIQGKPHTLHQRHVQNLAAEMASLGFDLFQGDSERSFAHPDGFAGTADYVIGNAVWDWKNKLTIDLDKKMVYDDHVIQLGSYAYGLKLVQPRCFSVFVGIEDAKVHIHEWAAEEIVRGQLLFNALFVAWRIKNRV